MKIQTLVAAIDQTDHSLAEKMNIQTDALIGNQCGRTKTETFSLCGCQVTYFHTDDRGVGKNRNRLLDYAEGEYLILADDDMRFVDGYPEIAKRAIEACVDADVYIFNLIERKPRRYVNQEVRRVGRRQYARYGAARLMLRRDAIERERIRFNLEFGGGAQYGSGEDTIFLRDCLARGLKLYAIPFALAEIDQEAPSSWFTGYNEKYFRDKGALYACLYPHLWPVMAVRFLLVHRKRFSGSLSFTTEARAMLFGGRSYRAEKRARQ